MKILQKLQYLQNKVIINILGRDPEKIDSLSTIQYRTTSIIETTDSTVKLIFGR
jgi:hypothetical protein